MQLSLQFRKLKVDMKFGNPQMMMLLMMMCQFSNWMSSSHFQCHRDVINDTKMRIGANTSRTAWRRGAGASAWVPSTRSRNRRHL